MIFLHEWSIVEGIIETIKNRVKENTNILEINIVIGELKGVDKDIILYALKELSKGSGLENVKFKMKIEKAKFKCRKCGSEWELEENEAKNKHDEIHEIGHNPNLIHTLTKCPKCQTSDFEVLKGDELWVENIKISE